jgi:hypothetical protein
VLAFLAQRGGMRSKQARNTVKAVQLVGKEMQMMERRRQRRASAALPVGTVVLKRRCVSNAAKEQ